MKILDYELKLTSIAVETIEDHYDKSIEEILDGKLRAKDVNFILWASMVNGPDLDAAKKIFAQFTYHELVEIMGGLLDPNSKRADTDNA